MKLTYSNIIGLSNNTVTFESRCDGTCRAIVRGVTEYAWDIRGGGIVLNLERWVPGQSKPSDAHAVTALLSNAFGNLIRGNY